VLADIVATAINAERAELADLDQLLLFSLRFPRVLR